MSEENKSFKVKDRRQFTAEGERRDGAAVEEAPARTTPPSAGHEPPAPTAAVASRRAPETPAEVSGDAPVYPADFSSLLLSLGSQASLLLLGDRETGGVDLSGARAIITLLEVLREKTEGRRTEQEEGLLEGLLYELRMAYVARSRAAGP